MFVRRGAFLMCWGAFLVCTGVLFWCFLPIPCATPNQPRSGSSAALKVMIDHDWFKFDSRMFPSRKQPAMVAPQLVSGRDWQPPVWRFGGFGAPNRRPNRHQQAPTGTNRHQQAPRGSNGFRNRLTFRHQLAPRGSPTGTNGHGTNRQTGF